jgi:hypothetical protein
LYHQGHISIALLGGKYDEQRIVNTTQCWLPHDEGAVAKVAVALQECMQALNDATQQALFMTCADQHQNW